MSEVHDKILDAYFGKMGEEFMRATHERVHWICSQVKGQDVLDVGCSQGIVPVLLGREGTRVLGIDSDAQAVGDAEDFLSRESASVQSNVDFICADFMAHDTGSRRFDSVIMSEVLEHLVKPDKFVDVAAACLVEGGRYIITVPFGVNDYVDHKRTYYALEPIKLIGNLFSIDEVRIFSHWIGFSCTKREAPVQQEFMGWPWQLMEDIESAFQSIERSQLKQIDSLREKLNQANAKYRIVTAQVAEQKQEVARQKVCEKRDERVRTQLDELRESLARERLQAADQLADAQGRADEAKNEVRVLLERAAQAKQLLEQQRVSLDLLTATLAREKAAHDAQAERAAKAATAQARELTATLTKRDGLLARQARALADTQRRLEDALRVVRIRNQRISDLEQVMATTKDELCSLRGSISFELGVLIVSSMRSPLRAVGLLWNVPAFLWRAWRHQAGRQSALGDQS